VVPIDGRSVGTQVGCQQKREPTVGSYEIIGAEEEGFKDLGKADLLSLFSLDEGQRKGARSERAATRR